jgi:uncharacterized protein (DUF362 family)
MASPAFSTAPAPTAAARAAAPVAVIRTAPTFEQVAESVQQAMDLAGWKQFITPGADVALKPNLGWDKLIPGAISAPWLVEAVILAIRDYAGSIYLVESDQVVVNVENALRLTRLDEVCHRHNVTWVNMSKGRFVRIQDPQRLVLRDIHIPEILTRTELITLPLLKTHNKSVVTGAIKNQWGCLDTLRHNFHPVLSEALVDVNTLAQPRFAVMDGTIGLEGDGPKSGRPREMNLVLASGNLAGLDATAARLMGFDPHTIEHLKLAAEHGFGAIPDLDAVVGVPVADAAETFIPAKHNMVSWVELLLRRSPIEWLIFHTPVLKLMAWGARRYYDLWDWRVGRRLRAGLFARTGYAAQWENR